MRSAPPTRLPDVQTKIQQLGWGAGASLVDDGSGVNGTHLSFTALNSGTAGRIIIDGGTTNISTRIPLSEAQDAAVFLGGGSGTQSQLITSSNNQIPASYPASRSIWWASAARAPSR